MTTGLKDCIMRSGKHCGVGNRFYTDMGTDYSEAATAVCRGFFVIMRTYRELCELIKTYRNR